MAWRKWLVRGLVFTVFGAIGLAVSLYQGFTSPAVIRQQVIDKLRAQMPGAAVTLDAAHLRLLGGIAIDGLRLARADDPDRVEFIHVPSAVIYHDKEQLLDGKLVIRKLELKNPHLHVIRSKDGRWNVAGILGRPRPDVPIPTVVVTHGTVLLEDYLNSPAPPVVEFKDVNATLLNDPLPQVTLKGSGNSDLAGRVSAVGTWRRDAGTVALTVEAGEVPVRPPLVHWLACYVPKLAEHARQLEGDSTLQADICFQPDSPRPWTHNVRFRLANGKLSHPRIPLPLDHVEAALRCFDGEVKLDHCTAQAGPSRLELSGWARLTQTETHSAGQSIESLTPPPDSLEPDGADFEGHLRIEHLQINSPLFAPLPEKLQKLNRDYEPNGPVNLTYHFARVAGQWKKHCVMNLEDLSATYEKFRYPLEHIKGQLEQEIDTSQKVDLLTVNLDGYAGRRKVCVRGTVVGEGPTSGVDVKIWGEDLTIDDKLLTALRQPTDDKIEKLARSFHPAGRLNFQALVRRPHGTDRFQNRYLIQFRDASVCYDVFPYPLENVSGELDVRPEHWEARDFHATHKGGTFLVRGRSHKEQGRDHLAVDIDGQNAALDAELKAALVEGKCKELGLGKTWNQFNPTGRINFAAKIEGLPEQPPEVDVTMTALGCGIKPAFFPCQLGDMTGTVRYVKRRVLASNVRARHGQSLLIVDDANAYLKADGGCWVDIVYLRGAPLVIDAEMEDALPGVLKSVCKALRIAQPTDLRTRLCIETKPDNEPTIFWDGELGFRDAAMTAGVPITRVTGKAGCRGTYNDRKLERLTGHVDLATATVLQQPLRNVQGAFEVFEDKPDVLIFPGLKGQLFGGEIYGPAHLEFGSVMRYDLNLTASGVRLEEFARHNLGPNAPVSGLAMASLYLSGQGNELQNLTGRGSVDIPNGRLYNLPALLGLLKILGLRLPDGTAFEEAHATFTLSGPRVHVHRVDLYGNLVSLRGQGEVNGQDIRLDFYAILSRVTQFLPVIKEITPAVSKQLWKIKMRGPLGSVRCTQEPVPALVEPLKEFLQTLAGRRGREQADKR